MLRFRDTDINLRPAGGVVVKTAGSLIVDCAVQVPDPVVWKNTLGT